MTKLNYKLWISGVMGLLISDYFSMLLVLILAILILLDTISGVMVAYKARVLQSKLMRKFTEKISSYSITIFSFYLVSQIQFYGLSFLWIFKVCTTYIIITEFFSIMEKMAYMGRPIPFRILNRLNDDFLKIIPTCGRRAFSRRRPRARRPAAAVRE